MSGPIAALAVLLVGAFVCLLAAGRSALARVLGPAVAVTGCLCGLPATLRVLAGGEVITAHATWSMPYGSLCVELDALSAVFAAPILVVTALAAVYGAEYLKPYEGRKNLAISWFWFNLLTGSMLLVVMARNAMLFLLAWETMSLASFFLVIFEHEREHVRHAGWLYLVATHVGTAFLLACFALLGRNDGSLDFATFSPVAAGPVAGAVFLFALVGFGAKAGFMPLHVWLPEAHPAAPSHISAVMSGVMIKTGIYGLLRVLTYLGAPPPWWGWTLVGVGAASGILGVLFALAQHDLKRLLAYHSVENIGIIGLGIGVGLLGRSYGDPAMAFLGFAGTLLHVINHAAFKSLLFLGAGSVLHATGTRELDHLGGLLKPMPVTAAVFLVGSVAICGLPPLNGFVSEFMIYLGSLRGLSNNGVLADGCAAATPLAIGSLALIGGLAVACFTKAFGVVFLGEPRRKRNGPVYECRWAMRGPMLLLAIVCVAIGLSGPVWLHLLAPACARLMSDAPAIPAGELCAAARALGVAAAIATAILVMTLVLLGLRRLVLTGKPVTTTVTWDCGYIAPTARMQYTASSFAAPITRLFHTFLRTRRRFTPPDGLFPDSSAFESDTPDVFQQHLYTPAFAALERFLGRFRWLQHGRLNLYVLYIVLALLLLLGWKLR